MTAVIKNLVIEQKAAFELPLTLKDKSKRPLNLTGYKARMQIRAADGSLIADLTTENGGIVITPLTGRVDLYISVSNTSAMSFTTANYDLKLIPPNLRDRRVMQGKVTLSIGQTE